MADNRHGGGIPHGSPKMAGKIRDRRVRGIREDAEQVTRETERAAEEDVSRRARGVGANGSPETQEDKRKVLHPAGDAGR